MKCEEMVEARHLLKIKRNVFSTGEIKGSYGNSVIYEQALVYKSKGGLTVIAGCAHPGILNIVKNVTKQFKEPVHTVIGGFHFKETPEVEIKTIIKKLKRLGVVKAGPTHCTGSVAAELFRKEFEDDFLDIKEGMYRVL